MRALRQQALDRGRLEERQQTLLFVILTERDTPLVPLVSQ